MVVEVSSAMFLKTVSSANSDSNACSGRGRGGIVTVGVVRGC